jgi:hypothetical protein
MVIAVRPERGGFVRPFGTAWFIIEFLKGNGPEDSRRIDPAVGAPMTDIHYEYKSALHRAHARDAVERAEERRIRRGKLAFTEEEYQDSLQYYLERIPYKELKMRYHSFVVYFGLLKRLKWVEEVKEEPSGPQEYHPNFQPRRYFRLTDAGWKATLVEISDPIMTLYRYSREQRSAKTRRYARY